jgi:hypothetical protein
MNVYLAGTDVSLTIPLQDRSGNPLDVTAVQYRITNHDDTELLPQTTLSAFNSGDIDVTVEIPASINSIAAIDPASITYDQIDAVSVREIRQVKLYLTVSGNTVMISTSYALEPVDVLIAGLNSFQSYPQAELVALELPELTGWSGASEKDKTVALVDARLRISQLRFINIGQNDMSHLTESVSVGDISLLTPTQFASLSPRFRMALNRAQVVEANAILGGDTVDLRRKEGLMLESIGEVKQMFRPGKPLELPVSKRTLKYLSSFVTFSKSIGRD